MRPLIAAGQAGRCLSLESAVALQQSRLSFVFLQGISVTDYVSFVSFSLMAQTATGAVASYYISHLHAALWIKIVGKAESCHLPPNNLEVYMKFTSIDL